MRAKYQKKIFLEYSIFSNHHQLHFHANKFKIYSFLKIDIFLHPLILLWKTPNHMVISAGSSRLLNIRLLNYAKRRVSVTSTKVWLPISMTTGQTLKHFRTHLVMTCFYYLYHMFIFTNKICMYIFTMQQEEFTFHLLSIINIVQILVSFQNGNTYISHRLITLEKATLENEDLSLKYMLFSFFCYSENILQRHRTSVFL